jgi:hypothetical protein
MRSRLLLFLVPLLAIAWALPASGAVGIRLSLDDLVERADRIAVVQLVESESWWGPDHRRIYTTWTLAVTEEVVGEGSETIELVLPGGTVGDLRQTISAVPSFEADVPTLVFLRSTEAGLAVVGLCQGALALQPERGEYVQRLDGVRFVDGDGGPFALPSDGAATLLRELHRRRAER